MQDSSIFNLERGRSILPVILLLFAASGCAALIYEIVWFQSLQLIIGSSAVSLGLLLAVYMGGLCLGSLALPRISLQQHPLRVYAALELAIGVLGLIVLWAMPLVSRLYMAGATQGPAGIVLRGMACALCVLLPTILMGATLPAISRWVEPTPAGISRMGFLYGANIAGGVLGCLSAGFYLLRIHDLAFATYVAVGINVAVAAVATVAAVYDRRESSTQERAAVTDRRYSSDKAVYAAIALSGFSALGAQVVWTRLLSFLLGVTVYTFSIILAVFLTGLGAGSAAGAFIARRTLQPRTAFGICQIGLAAAIAWTAFMVAASLPYWPIDPWLSMSPWFNFQVDMLRTFAMVFPPTLLWGASFPLALAAAASPGQDPARLSGAVYAANTAGAILGATVFTVVLIPSIGTRQSQQLLIALSAFAALMLLRRGRSLAITAVLSAALLWTVPDIPWRMIAYGHRIAPTLRAVQLYPTSATHLLYRGEGMSSSIVIAESDAGQRSYHVNGKTEATTALEDMRLQRMLGHLPALVHPNPRSVLSWGFGAGVTAGSFVVHPGIEKMVICEIEPLVPSASTEFFATQNYNVMKDPRTRIVYDDARHYLLNSSDKFDIITSDPLDPWAKGTAMLYTREFFEAVKQRLNPRGMFAQFVQLYESNEETVKSQLATFSSVFDDVTLWSNNVEGQGYDLVLVGRTGASAINVDDMQQRLERPDHTMIAKSLSDVGFHSAVELLATYAGRGSDLAPWLKNAEINEDINLRLQYLGGMGINAGAHEGIYRELSRYKQFPADLFTGAPPRLEALRTIVRAKTKGN
jgi:spermidine synthase